MNNGDNLSKLSRKEKELINLDKIYDKSSKTLVISRYADKRKINIFLKPHPYMNALYSKKLEVFNKNMSNQFLCVISVTTSIMTSLTFFAFKKKISRIFYMFGMIITNALYHFYFFYMRINTYNEFYNSIFKELFFDNYFSVDDSKIFNLKSKELTNQHTSH